MFERSFHPFRRSTDEEVEAAIARGRWGFLPRGVSYLARTPRPALLHGGLSQGAAPGRFDPEELEKGIRIEMEHTNQPKVAMLIAMDHLAEIPDYYTRLAKMEAQATAFWAKRRKP